MTEVNIYRDKAGRIVKYKVEGHTGAGAEGNDIVCAAVSAVTQAAIVGLEEVAGIKPKIRVRNGYLECEVPQLEGQKRERADVILETMFLSVKNLQEQHGKFLKVIEIFKV